MTDKKLDLMGIDFSRVEARLIAIAGATKGAILVVGNAGEGLAQFLGDSGYTVEQFAQLGKRRRPDLMVIDDPMRSEDIRSLIEIHGRQQLEPTQSAHSLERPYGWYRKFEKRNGKRNK